MLANNLFCDKHLCKVRDLGGIYVIFCLAFSVRIWSISGIKIFRDLHVKETVNNIKVLVVTIYSRDLLCYTLSSTLPEKSKSWPNMHFVN